MASLTECLYQCINDEIDSMVNFCSGPSAAASDPATAIDRLDARVYSLLADGAELPFFRQNFAQISASIKSVSETLAELSPETNPDFKQSIVSRLKSVQTVWRDLRNDINRADADLRAQQAPDAKSSGPSVSAGKIPLPLREQLNQLELEIRKLVLIKKI